ncbi:MAG TPA: DUF2946 family protein [Steroidobacteraceae bacterium]
MLWDLPRLRKRRRWLALLVLPALLLRAAIPAGFMPVLDAHGGLSIGFCPGQTAGPGILPGAYLHHHHHSGSGGQPDPSVQHHVPCLFAASAGGAPAPSDAGMLAVRPSAVAAVAADFDRLFLPAIVRVQSPRGPPASG